MLCTAILWYAFKQMWEFQLLPAEWNHGLIGIAASIIFSLIIIQITRLLLRFHLQLKV